MNKKIKKILKDLYKLDPKLKSKEKEIISFIGFLLDSKPELELDKKFISELHEKIKQEIKLNTNNTQKVSFENKNNYLKNIAYFTFTLTACFAFIITAIYFFNQSKTIDLDLGGVKISQVEANKFGVLNLHKVNNVDGRGAGDTGDYMLTKPSETMFESFIYNPINYNYNYVGDDFELDGTEAYVYKYKNISDSSKEMAKIFKNVNFGLIDINKFTNLGLRNLSLVEDKDFGYSINLDLLSGTVNIGENYEKWQNDIKANCIGEVECLEKTMLKSEDMISEEKIIKIADDFLSNYKINKNNYDKPIIRDNSQNFFAENNQDREYIPEIVQVIYPLLVEGKKVYDERAYPVGLNINVSIRHKKVSGVYNLRVENYESSLYEINTSTKDILEKAKKGGLRSYLMDNSEIKNVDIDSPEIALIKIYNYNGVDSEELLVPGMIFEVKNKPDNYNGNDKVVVILVDEVVEERNEPVYRIM